MAQLGQSLIHQWFNGMQMKSTWLAFPAAALLIFQTTLLNSAERELSWTDLIQHIEFADPFEKLTSEQLTNLGLYARVQGLLKSAPERVNDAMQQEAEEAEQTLRAEGVDIEELMNQRLEIMALREKQANAVVPELNGIRVKIAGYALPLEYRGNKTTEFLLVPWVGACIHTPPPPPNQIVYVSNSDGYLSRGLFEPIWVTGELNVKQQQRNLYLTDGSADIHVGYEISADSVSPYQVK
jgi:hypothetical protein